jgi:hypothetical protein
VRGSRKSSQVKYSGSKIRIAAGLLRSNCKYCKNGTAKIIQLGVESLTMSQSPAAYRRKTTIATALILLSGAGCFIADAQSADEISPTVASDSSLPTQLSSQSAVAADSSAHVVFGATALQLPDAPTPQLATAAVDAESTSLPREYDFLEPGDESAGLSVAPGSREELTIRECVDDKTHARECRPHWRQLLISSSVYNAFQNAGNLYTGYWYRYETTTGPWFQRWFNSDLGWRWGQWEDGNPFLDEYVGHPMMGSITSYLWIQNDPRGMTVDFANNHEYWHSRLVAMVYAAAYSFEWKFGPFGEAGVGHNGDHLTNFEKGDTQNDTGDVELVTTPIGGFGWTIAEDILDRYVTQRFEAKPRGPIALTMISFLTPARGTANILRFRPPWYRDGRDVKAKSFFSAPPSPEDVPAGDQPASGHAHSPTIGPAAPEAEDAEAAAASSNAALSAAVSPARNGNYLPVWPHYGGVHEFGAWWGLSLISGHIWGYAKDIKYMPIDVNYSYLINPDSKRWNFRYAPEVTALALMDQPNPTPKATYSVPLAQDLRQRFYGSGVSPVGFRASFLPQSRVQPFLSGDGGFIYFDGRVLSPEGSQYMYTVDYGAGLTFFRKQRQSFTIGYRYQHLSNANISEHNPGTDANTFYVQVSRYRTKGYR